MSFLHSTDLGSDTDDDDYDPTQDGEDAKELSEEEEDNNGANTSKGKKASKASKALKAVPVRGLFPLSTEEQSVEEERKKEFGKEKEERKKEEEKKKDQDLWADFKKETKPRPKPKPSGSGLGFLSSINSSKKPTAKTAKTKVAAAKPHSIVSSIFDSFESDKKDEKKSEEKKEEVKTPEETETTEDGKVKITKVLDFAGENITVTKEVDKDSKEAKKFTKDQEDAEKKRIAAKRPGVAGGLASVMDVISGKKAKMGCLDKSKIDWDSYVAKEGLKEELSTHNKGKDGFVEKQAFLERADHRRFEMEKEAREKSRKTFNR